MEATKFYTHSNSFSPKDAWDNLSIKEKAEMMKVAIRNGITNLGDIKTKYNEFAEGGDTDWSYSSWKKQIAEHMGINPDEDNTYDYEAYFNKYPEEAWKMLKGDPTAHFSDEFKTVYHPTFSSKSIGNNGSIYSGVRNPQTNPQGLVGGIWSPDYHTFTMSPDGYRGPVNMDDRKWYLENAEDNGVVLREADGSLPIYDGIPWGGVLPNVTVYGNKRAEGGNIFKGGGYKPSTSVKKRISTWEGTAMTGAKDPLSGKWGKNRSFEAEADSFYNALPSNIRNQVLSNPDLADNLFSYSYNVGAGNFKKRVVPALIKYYNGKGSAEEIVNSMWASGDNKLRGLRKRRAAERKGVVDALSSAFMPQAADNTFVLNPYITQVENTQMLPIMVPDEDSYVTTHEVSPAEQKAIKFNAETEAMADYNRLMNTISILNNSQPEYAPANSIYTLKGLGGPIVEAAMNEYKNGGGIHIKHPGRLTALKKRTGKTEAQLWAEGKPEVRKMITFARNARKWKHGDGGELDTYNEPQTFAGRIAEVAGASPSIVRGTDVVSSVVQMTPWGHYVAAADLGRDLNRVYHKETGAKKDVAFDILSMLPGISAPGLKAAENAWNIIKGNNKLRKALNAGIITGRVADFVDDTWGANKTSKALGGNLFSGEENHSNQMNIFRRPNGEYFYQASPDSEEITVTPLNTMFDNPALWTYTDTNGKIYTPRQTANTNQGTIAKKEDEGPLVEAAKNYLGELQYDINNGIPIRGKYTMPAIAASALLPLAGEAFAGTSIAGIPATTWADATLTAGFGAHGLNHAINEGIDGWGDAAMTALEVAPLGRLAKPIAKETALAVENYRYPLGRPQVPNDYLTVKPQVRTRIGDVEIDNPNLLYHLDRGNGAGAFSNQGAYVEDGRLLPGIAKEDEIPYSWWNLGRPYASSVNGQPMTRLMTAAKDTPEMLHVRSQNYPIGQWNGKRGLVLNSEYVNPEGVDVSKSTYTLDPNYGWRRVFAEETPATEWPMGRTASEITAENTVTRAQEIQELIPRYNKFAEYYGYNTIPEGASVQEAENLIKEGLKQHNTFYRGLTYPEGEKLEAVKKVLGENASREEIMDYLAKSGSRDPGNTYFSLDERANQYARTGDVARYTRKYTLGDSPSTWLEDADFAFDTTPATSMAPKGSINYPWAGSYIKEAPGEVRINPEDVTFEEWMPKTTWEYGEYVKPSEYRANRNLYFNENAGGTKPTFEASARDVPTITAENAASITPEQWTAAQDAAIARGDMAEAQRLRDLHFKVNAPDTQIKDIQYHGAKGNVKFNVFDPKLIGQTDQGWAGKGYYFTPSIDYAKMYGSEPRAFYINAQKVHDGTAATYFGREDGPAAMAFKIIRKRHGNDGQQILDELASSDAIRTSFPQTQPYNGTFEEIVARNNNQMKLADAVTYNDKGVRIPLGERDNFNINDIRYGLLPFGIGLTGYGLFSNQKALGGRIKKRKR